MKEDQGKDQLELTSNITDIMDALETEIKTEFQQQIGEIKESQRTNLLEMSKNATEINKVINIQKMNKDHQKMKKITHLTNSHANTNTTKNASTPHNTYKKHICGWFRARTQQ